MYHNSGFFNSHESHPIRGKEAEAFSFHHEFPASTMDLDNFRFNLKQEFPHCHDPSILSSPSFLHMLVPPHAHTQSEVFLGELPADSASVASTVYYDPTTHLGLPDQHHPLHPAPPYGGSLDERLKMKSKKKQSPNVEKHEKQRRERLAEKFDILKSIIPNSTKPDRATIVSDAMDYIKELLRTIDELKVMVEKRSRKRDRNKTMKMKTEVVAGDMESSSKAHLVDSSTRSRRQWIQRKSKEALVDVRIVEEEVTIKITERAKNNSLLAISKVLDKLQLELIHLSGGNIGEHHIFLFNAKIHESSPVFASAIADKLVEVVDLPSSIVP